MTAYFIKMLRKILLTIWLLAAICQAEQLVTTDCSKLPKSISPKSCCRFPELFQSAAFDLCHNLHREVGQCFVNCIFTSAGICHQGKCNYNKAVDYLDRELTLKGSPFKNIYKRAFKKCIAKANDMRSNMVQRFKRRGCDPLPEIIRFCMRNEMFTSCPSEHWNGDVIGCASKRDFIRNCIRDD